MTSSSEPVRITIVAEWENVLLSDMKHCLAMLDQLKQQIGRLFDDGSPANGPGFAVASPIELLVAYDAGEVPEGQPEAIVGRALAEVGPWVALTYLPTHGSRYYELKNLAVANASGEIVVMIDSDVTPESDWLVNLLATFADPAVSVVGGNSYIDPSNTYARAFALGWLLPLRAEGGELHKANAFYANNVAFRTEVILQHPFPELSGACRGAGSLLAAELRSEGIDIYRNPLARVSHPPHRHFVRRGIAQGRDNLIRRRYRPGRESIPIGESFGDVRNRIARAWRRIRKRHDRVGMSAAAMPAAMLIMAAYYGLYLAGDIMMRVAPDAMRKHFRV